MLDFCSLRSLYQSQLLDPSVFEVALLRYFKDNELPTHDEILFGCAWEETLMSEEKNIENWKKLLSANVFCYLTESFQSAVCEKVCIFEKQPWNQDSQYIRSLIALNHAFSKLAIPEVGPYLLESGAALIDLRQYSPWLALPYTPYHFEYGIFLCILALLTKRQDLLESALGVAKWQSNTLDNAGIPLAGLYVRESEGENYRYFYLSYLLYRAASFLSEESCLFEGLSQAARQKLSGIQINQNIKINPLWPLLEAWLDRFEASSSHKLSQPASSDKITASAYPLKLTEQIYDPSMALIGYRSDNQHVVCTLHGDKTGMGAFRYRDVEIINYGPQHCPLENCLGFGIEGNALSDHGIRRSSLEWRPQAFLLKGCTRFVDRPNIGQHRGIWLEATQEFKKPDLYIKTTFLGLDEWESVAFCFFVKACACRISSQEVFKPRSLIQYEGEIQTLCFDGENGTVVDLRMLNFKGRMQVLPLAGGKSFWGADFLIAYYLALDQSQYHWHIGPQDVFTWQKQKNTL